MPNQYLAQLVRTPPDRLKQEEKELLDTWKKAIYEDVLRTVKNVPDWLFKDKQDLPKVLRALRRRDLPCIAQAVQTSPRFYTICENCGLFDVEPLLWDKVCHVIHEIQKEISKKKKWDARRDTRSGPTFPLVILESQQVFLKK